MSCSSNLCVPSASLPSCSTAGDCTGDMSCKSGKCVPNNLNLYAANGINSQSCFFPKPVPNHLDEYCGGYALWNIGGKPLPSSIATPSIPANTQWVQVARNPEKLFKIACPSAYSYQFDDSFSTFQCQGESNADQTSYAITFCPQGSPGAAN
jgi:Thaumatin family